MYLKYLSGILEDLCLSLVQVEEWIQIQRARFDLRINEEPYHSIQIYANLDTRTYLVRVWGRTLDRGNFVSEEDLKFLCITNFQNTSACVGYLGPHPGGGLKLVQERFPCPRWVSKKCEVTFSQSTENLIIGLCPTCSGTDMGIKKEGVKEDVYEEPEPPPVALVKGFLKQELHTEDVGDDSSDMNFNGENSDYDEPVEKRPKRGRPKKYQKKSKPTNSQRRQPKVKKETSSVAVKKKEPALVISIFKNQIIINVITTSKSFLETGSS